MSDLQVGRELDALVAEKVMGRECVKVRGECCGPYCPVHDFSPSTDIAAAWEVVEKLQQDFELLFSVTGGWRARMSNPEASFLCAQEYADTAPLAICRVALKAMGA